MQYVLSLNGTLAEMGNIATLHSYGNYMLNITMPNSTKTAFRFWFFDSDTNTESVNADQVWPHSLGD